MVKKIFQSDPPQNATENYFCDDLDNLITSQKVLNVIN